MARVSEFTGSTHIGYNIRRRKPLDRMQNYSGNPAIDNMLNKHRQQQFDRNHKSPTPVRRSPRNADEITDSESSEDIDISGEIEDNDLLNCTLSPCKSWSSLQETSPQLSRRSINNRSTSYVPEPTNSPKKSRSFHAPPGSRENSQLIEKDSTSVVCSCIVVLLLLLIGYIYAFGLPWYSSEEITVNKQINLEDELQKIVNSFPSQTDDLWNTFASGIHEANSTGKPRVFVLLYDKSSGTSRKLAKRIASLASVMLAATNYNPLELEAGDLNTDYFLEDHGRFVTKYSPELKDRRSMIILNIDKMSGKVARSLHSFCDEYTPLVHKSIIIFTMQVDDAEEKNEVVLAEKKLINKWGHDLDTDILMPLVTRMTGSVLKVVSETTF